MKKEMKRIETPDWLTSLFKSIDELDFSENSGFYVLRDSVVMQFGREVVEGIEDAKEYFVKLDSPYDTVHYVHDVYQIGDNTFVMHGSATIAPKDGSSETIKVSPLINILWLDEKGQVERYVVDYPPHIEEKK
ncbi:hypothetical protein [Vibrio sp. YIC-376]|uniref:hypothetical protein n=1 Tax=Vibrio sp. YIC-376 TaxID=3136162 RepID=UPI00402AA6AB